MDNFATHRNFDYMFELLLIGNSSVGKGSFLLCYDQESYTSGVTSAIGLDFKIKTLIKDNKRVKLQIWDTAGQERFRTITSSYYRGASGILLMYDVTDKKSFDDIRHWYRQIKTESSENASVILVGNKSYLEDERVVSTDQGRQLAEQLGLAFLETSTNDVRSVSNAFEHLVDLILEQKAKSADPDTRVKSSGSQLKAGASSEKPSGCSF